MTFPGIAIFCASLGFNLLVRLGEEIGCTDLIVSHGPAVVDLMCDLFAGMLGGKVVEVLPSAAIPDSDATMPCAVNRLSPACSMSGQWITAS